MTPLPRPRPWAASAATPPGPPIRPSASIPQGDLTPLPSPPPSIKLHPSSGALTGRRRWGRGAIRLVCPRPTPWTRCPCPSPSPPSTRPCSSCPFRTRTGLSSSGSSPVSSWGTHHVYVLYKCTSIVRKYFTSTQPCNTLYCKSLQYNNGGRSDMYFSHIIIVNINNLDYFCSVL